MQRISATIFIVMLFIFGVLPLELRLAHAQQGELQKSVDFLEKQHTVQELRTISIGDYIAKLYRASLYIGAFLAVGMIIFGALEKILYASRPDKQSEGNDRIISAMWGLALLAGSVLILRTVNPEIVKLKPPEGLPLCSGEATDTPGKNCLKVPITKICGSPLVVGEIQYTNCLPACQASVTPCGPYEKPGNNGCVPCIKKEEKCPETLFQKTIVKPDKAEEPNPNYCVPVLTCAETAVESGSRTQIMTQIPGVPIVPVTIPTVTLRCTASISMSADDARGLNLNQIGKAWQYPYYNKSEGPVSAKCRVYAIKKIGDVTQDQKFEYRTDNLEGWLPC